jgi:hypothetical protein
MPKNLRALVASSGRAMQSQANNPAPRQFPVGGSDLCQHKAAGSIIIWKYPIVISINIVNNTHNTRCFGCRVEKSFM